MDDVSPLMQVPAINLDDALNKPGGKMRFLSALNPDRDVWKAGLRTAAAGGLAFVCAEVLALPQGYWAVLTAIVVMQASIGASLAAAADRLLGTLAGAALGLVLASVTPSTKLGTLAALILSIGMLAMLAARYPSFRIAPMTAAILLISAPSHEVAFISALHRVIEIALGCGIGIAVALIVVPSRADTRLRKETGRTLALLAKLIMIEMEGPSGKAGDEALAAVSEDIYAAYHSIDTLTNEVREEHASHLTRDGLDPKRLRRCMRHLRTTAFFLQRITRLPWPVSLGDALLAPTRTVTEAMRDYLLTLAPAVEAGAQPPSLQDLEHAFAQFATAITAARQQQAADEAQNHGRNKTRRKADEHAVAFVSAFSFALEQLRYSIEKLAECVADMSKAAERS